MEISPLICRANQWTGFYMITAPVMKELKIADFNHSSFFVDSYFLLMNIDAACGDYLIM